MLKLYTVPVNVDPCSMLSASRKWTPEPTLNKTTKIVPWYCTHLKNRLPDIFETTTGFPTKTRVCALGQHCTSNFLYNVVSDVFGQHWLDNIFLCSVVSAWSIQHWIGYFPSKSCLLPMGQHCTGNFLVKCWPRETQKTL